MPASHRFSSTTSQKHDRELFVVVLLTAQNDVIGITTAATGTIDMCGIYAREVFKPALLANAASIVVAHNHPSGDPTPSPEDLEVTRLLVAAGKLLQVTVLDHIVIGCPARKLWRSLATDGLM